MAFHVPIVQKRAKKGENHHQQSFLFSNESAQNPALFYVDRNADYQTLNINTTTTLLQQQQKEKPSSLLKFATQFPNDNNNNKLGDSELQFRPRLQTLAVKEKEIEGFEDRISHFMSISSNIFIHHRTYWKFFRKLLIGRFIGSVNFVFS